MFEPAVSVDLPDARRGRLRRPDPAPAGTVVPAGRSALHVDGEHVGLWYVPRTGAKRLVVLLHGAGGSDDDGLRLLINHADERGLMLFAPQSVGRTWDFIGPGYGADVARIQRALDGILAAHHLSPPRVAIGGFSDGASYALSLGLTNGDVFDAILAFSPGFAAPAARVQRPACFVSHGRRDRVLPIDRCSRRIVPELRDAGYSVEYHEFDGGHEVPPGAVTAALTWLSAVDDGWSAVDDGWSGVEDGG